MELSLGEFSIVSNMFSFTIAAMGASALFFYFASGLVSPRYRSAVLVSAAVVTIACYHYFRIYESWHEGYTMTQTEAGATYVESDTPFNDAYRYADWILTVPLLVIELVAVMALAKKEAGSLTFRLATAALAMIALGYPGEISDQAGIKWLFWGLSMIPFLYIMFVLLTELSSSLARQPEEVRGRISIARYIIIVTWSFYPIAYLASFLGGSQAEVILQVGYTIADVTAKAGFGLYIYSIAAAKTELESAGGGQTAPAVATA